jgi:hypothetical protein
MGVLTHTATLTLRDLTGRVFYSHTYPPPPPHAACKTGTDSIVYAIPDAAP